jgi:hypothetical protein
MRFVRVDERKWRMSEDVHDSDTDLCSFCFRVRFCD